MSDTVRHPGSAVDSSEAHVSDQTARDDSTTSDHDKEEEEERGEEEDVEAVSSPVTGSAGVVGLSRNHSEVEAPASNGEHEKVAPAEQSTETNENGDTKDVEVGKGDAEEEDEEANMVFPSGIPLALLTFGLCMAT
jgi:hypothetical protein